MKDFLKFGRDLQVAEQVDLRLNVGIGSREIEKDVLPENEIEFSGCVFSSWGRELIHPEHVSEPETENIIGLILIFEPLMEMLKIDLLSSPRERTTFSNVTLPTSIHL